MSNAIINLSDIIIRMSVLPYNNPAEKYQFMYHFLPHPVHRTRARLLSHQAFSFYTLLLLAILLLVRTIPMVLPGVLGYASDIQVDKLLNETNNIRAQNGLGTLRINDALSQAAYNKAQSMFEEDYWAHVSPSGKEPWDFILTEGYDYSYAGENLAKNFNGSEEVVVAWYNSPSHRENLLNPNYEEIGFAVVNGNLEGYDTTLVVQMFGKSRAAVLLDTSTSGGENQVPSTSDLADTKPAESQVIPLDLKVDSSSRTTTVLSSSSLSYKPSLYIDINVLSRVILISFTAFIGVLLVLDVWYSKKKSVPKLTGHTLAHLGFLLLVLGSVWLSMSPGRIL